MKNKGALVAIGITGVVVVLMIMLFSIGNSGPTTANTDTSGLQGLQTTKAPWKPESNSLAQRVSSLKLPSVGNESYHQHAILQVSISGKMITVPNKVGFYQGGVSPLHTHDATGTIHMEAGAPYPFTLGQFFDVWGVTFSEKQIGAYKNANDQSVQVFVNGKKIDDPVNYQMKEKDKIVVGYGKDGEVPKDNTAEFPKNL